MSAAFTSNRPQDVAARGQVSLEVTVNKAPIHFSEREVTGAVIKETAIAQGVSIQQDFVLYRVEGHGELILVRDDERVHLHEREAFQAVTPDDVSEV